MEKRNVRTKKSSETQTADVFSDEKKKYRDTYKKMPAIITAVTGALFFIVSVVCAVSYRKVFIWLASSLIGVAICLTTYFILKRVISILVAYFFLYRFTRFLTKNAVKNKKSETIKGLEPRSAYRSKTDYR